MLLVILVLSISLMFFATGWRNLSPAIRMPLITYCGAYAITTLIGATLIGLTNNSFSIKVLSNFGINIALLPNKFDYGYWLLLYGPMIIPLWIVFFANKFLPKLRTVKFYWLNQPVSLLSFWFVFVLFLGYFLTKMISIISEGTLLSLLKNIDYQSSILLRYQLIKQFGDIFYGLAYSTLPTFSHVALYQWSKTRSTGWAVTFLISFLFISTLFLMIIMKAVLLVYLVSIGLGLYILKIVRSLNFLLLISGVIWMVITLYQSFVLASWQALDSFILIIFRIASSFPFYYILYPKILPFTGIYIPGVNTPPHDNQIVFTYMHPSIDWVIGNVTGASSLLAYSQGGFGFALFVMIVTGFFILLISQIGNNIRGPLQYALYIQALVFLYYLTQISIQSAFITSYGIIWGLVGIVILWLISIVFQSALSNQTLKQSGS